MVNGEGESESERASGEEKRGAVSLKRDVVYDDSQSGLNRPSSVHTSHFSTARRSHAFCIRDHRPSPPGTCVRDQVRSTIEGVEEGITLWENLPLHTP